MITTSQSRLRVPSRARRGEIIEIKTPIAYDTGTGSHRNADGRSVPRRIVNTFEAAFNGKAFFTANWNLSISADPYQAFFFKASESGEFKFTWKDDDGSTYEATSKLTVA